MRKGWQPPVTTLLLYTVKEACGRKARKAKMCRDFIGRAFKKNDE